MKKLILLPIVLFTFSIFSQNIEGYWKAVSDKTNEVNSILEIYKINEKYHAKIVAIPNRNSEKCSDCKGKYHNKNIIGLEILSNSVKKENTYEDGQIMDPENAKTYSCYLKLINSTKLKIRGYIGFSLLGRTQYWYRLKKDEETQLISTLNK